MQRFFFILRVYLNSPCATSFKNLGIYAKIALFEAFEPFYFSKLAVGHSHSLSL